MAERRVRRFEAAWLAAAGLGLSCLSQPPFDVWPLAFVAFVPHAFFAETRAAGRSFLFGWGTLTAVGLAVGGGALHHALAVEYALAVPAALAFAALLVGAYALPAGLALAACAALRPRAPAVAAPLLFAALYTAAEWLRAEPLGMPWILPGQPLVLAPLWLQVADLAGVHGVGLAPLLASGGLGVCLARRRGAALVAPVLLLALVAGYGGWRLSGPPAAGPALSVGVVHVAVPQEQRFVPGSALRNVESHALATRRLLEQHALDLVVWSETAVDEDLDASPVLRRGLQKLVDTTGVPLLTGAPLSEDAAPVNAAVLFAPGVEPRSYAKQRLVPFAEADPPAFLAWLAPLAGPLGEGTPYRPGPGPTLLSSGGVALATPICFEIIYPDLTRAFRDAGAELIVNLSNDAWFGNTAYLPMHFRHAVVRAVELRSWVVRAANAGISGVIDPHGRITARIEPDERTGLAAEVRATRQRTFYGRFGDAPLLAGLALLVGLTAAVGRGAGRSPRS